MSMSCFSGFLNSTPLPKSNRSEEPCRVRSEMLIPRTDSSLLQSLIPRVSQDRLHNRLLSTFGSLQEVKEMVEKRQDTEQ